MRHSSARHAAWLIALALGLACTPGSDRSEPLLSEPVSPSAREARRLPHEEAAAALDAVLAGNAQSIAAAPLLVPPGAPLTPFAEARLHAIANVAMHDALNAIVRGHRTVEHTRSGRCRSAAHHRRHHRCDWK